MQTDVLTLDRDAFLNSLRDFQHGRVGHAWSGARASARKADKQIESLALEWMSIGRVQAVLVDMAETDPEGQHGVAPEGVAPGRGQDGWRLAREWSAA